MPYVDAAGVKRRLNRQISGRLAAGQVASIDTGIGPYAAGSQCPATVIAARVAE